MANSNNRQVVPEAKAALNQMKLEIANELGMANYQQVDKGNLTARENVFLNGALLGYGREEMEKHYDNIVEFSELQNFMDVPVKNFSSGMVSRLAFAIATIGTPDILIVDEVLSVGDFRFQQKCEERIRKMMEHGTTILFVSHSIAQVESLCEKIVWLEHGHVKRFGDADEICKEYSQSY